MDLVGVYVRLSFENEKQASKQESKKKEERWMVSPCSRILYAKLALFLSPNIYFLLRPFLELESPDIGMSEK
jgi:hypothetical protein